MDELLRVEQNLRHKAHIGKFVKVKTVDSKEHQGWLYCIDPMTGNLVLVNVDGDCSSITDREIIMGHAYTDFEVLIECDEKVKNFLERYAKEVAEAMVLRDRKMLLVSWIKKNRLPVVEKADQSLVVANCVTIVPPYEADNCSGRDNIPLKNTRKLIERLPSYVASFSSRSDS